MSARLATAPLLAVASLLLVIVVPLAVIEQQRLDDQAVSAIGVGGIGAPPPQVLAVHGGGCTIPDPTGTGGCVTPIAAHFVEQFRRSFPGWAHGLHCFGRRPSNPTSDHPKGRACDVTVGPGGVFPPPQARDDGWEVARWLETYHDALGISYMIYDGLDWNPRRGTWDPYTSRSYDVTSPVGGHYEHIHISFKASHVPTAPVVVAPAPAAEIDGCTGVPIAAGQDWQPILAAHGPGTTYCIGAGTHRLVQVIPDHGDRFIGAGQGATILSGARDLKRLPWTRSGSRWSVGGQTQQAQALPNCYGDYCKLKTGGNPLHLQPEELFVDGVRWDEVASLGAVDGPGEWYFDYASDRIWLAADPSSLGRIETSVATGAFGGNGVRGVVVANLTMQMYATHPQYGAVGFYPQGATHDWTLISVDAFNNAGGGINIGPGMTIDGCRVSHNGQLGIGGSGRDRWTGSDYTAPVTIRRCSISHSPMLDYDWGWEAGATKFKHVEGMTFTNNHVHTADAGIWFDVYNTGPTTIANNLVEDVTWRGIFYEISTGPVDIANNVVQRVGKPTVSTWHGVYGIVVSNSRDVTVRGNILRQAGNPLGVKAQGRYDGTGTTTANVRFERNDVQVFSTPTAGAGYVGITDPPGHYANVIWANNLYRLTPGDDAHRFRQHANATHTFDGWRNAVEPTARLG